MPDLSPQPAGGDPPPLDVVPGGQPPALPADEAERLADLRALGALDSGPDPDIDSLVDLAALIADTRIALLSLVDEHEQVFKSSVGLDVERLPRETSFCGHAILDGAHPMVVPDATLDTRFADNPLVTDGPVGFYAGVPILTSQGHAIGTLCVVDDSPRDLSDRQLAALGRLAAQAAGILEARGRSAAERRRAAAHEGDIDPRTGLLLRDALVQSLSGAPLPPLSSAIALRIDEIDATAGRAGLLADGAIEAVGGAISACLPPAARLGRSFGTFVVMLPGVDGAAARAVVASIRNRMRGAVIVGERTSLHVGVTAGVATAGHATTVGAEDLIAAAEDALQQSETFGITCFVLDDDAREARARTAAIRSALGDAVAQGQLVVHYQPIVALPSREVVGAEALVRWRHPGLGLLGPNEFIPFAEDMGIVQEIDRYVLRRALNDLSHGRTPGREVSVNLSPVSVRPSLPEVVASDLREARVPPSSLVLELTERVRFDRDPDVVEILRAVGDVGVQVAIDDFGAGTTSLAHLRALPVSRLKLDRSLTADLTGPDADRARVVVRTLVELAGHLGLEVVAEGIETEGQAQVVSDQGVPLAQGFLFGRPGPLSEA